MTVANESPKRDAEQEPAAQGEPGPVQAELAILGWFIKRVLIVATIWLVAWVLVSAIRWLWEHPLF